MAHRPSAMQYSKPSAHIMSVLLASHKFGIKRNSKWIKHVSNTSSLCRFLPKCCMAVRVMRRKKGWLSPAEWVRWPPRSRSKAWLWWVDLHLTPGAPQASLSLLSSARRGKQIRWKKPRRLRYRQFTKIKCDAQAEEKLLRFYSLLPIRKWCLATSREAGLQHM